MVKNKKVALTIRQKLTQKTRKNAKKFKLEIKKAISTAIVAAFGFIIALSWKDVLLEYIDTLMKSSPIKGKLIGAIIITIISVAGIIIITKFLSEKTN